MSAWVTLGAADEFQADLVVEGEEHGGDLIDAAGVFGVRVFGIKGRKLGGSSRVGEVGGYFLDGNRDGMDAIDEVCETLAMNQFLKNGELSKRKPPSSSTAQLVGPLRSASELVPCMLTNHPSTFSTSPFVTGSSVMLKVMDCSA